MAGEAIFSYPPAGKEGRMSTGPSACLGYKRGEREKKDMTVRETQREKRYFSQKEKKGGGKEEVKGNPSLQERKEKKRRTDER